MEADPNLEAYVVTKATWMRKGFAHFQQFLEYGVDLAEK